MRVAGQMRRVPRKIMLDPSDETQFVLAQRNRDTGELEPVLRRGSPRLIERGNDGYWRVTTNYSSLPRPVPGEKTPSSGGRLPFWPIHLLIVSRI